MKTSRLAILRLLFMTSCCAIIHGCGEDMASEPDRPVIEGWIDSDGTPVVLFSSSLAPHGSGGSLADKMIRWGCVTISDGTDTEILTGGPSREYFPPYRYYSYHFKGVPGHTYTITADYENFHAEASCTMPEPTPIDTIEFAAIAGNDTLKSGILRFTAPADVPAYYQVTIRDLDSLGRELPALLGSVEAAVAHQELAVPLLMPKTAFSDHPFVPQLRSGKMLKISLCRISEPAYRFWYAYDNSISLGFGLLNGANSLPGNIIGGYGVWSARGVDSRVVCVP